MQELNDEILCRPVWAQKSANYGITMRPYSNENINVSRANELLKLCYFCIFVIQCINFTASYTYV